MKILTKRNRTIIVRAAVASILPIAMMASAQGADTNPVVPINLVAPAGIPNVAPLPFTGVKTAAFTTPETMVNLTVTPDQGVVGNSMTISGKGLAASTSINLSYGTFDATWVADIQPNSVNYLGYKFTKNVFIDIANVTTDGSGNFSYTTKIPSDFGGIHDIYAVVNNVAVAHGGFQYLRTMTISPTSGPIGTPITVTYTGLGASLYTAGAALHWDNSFAGEMQAFWTRGTAKAVIRAAGPVGAHTVEVKDAITFAYLNIVQSPVPYANGGAATFRVTKDAGLPAPSVDYPVKMEPTVSQRTTLSSVGLDPNTKAVATLSASSGDVNSKTTVSVTGLTSTGAHQIVWASVVGNRVNCTGTCWNYTSIPLGQANVTDGTLKSEVTIPDHLGGWHVIQIKKGDVIEAQVPFYVKESMMPFYDKNGNLIGQAIAKADNSGTLEAFQKGNSGAATTTFKNGEEITISIKGVGWTQLDNTLAVTYDNSYIGYGCGFNSNGYMVIHIRATGAPGTHIIDLHPLLYTNQPSFAGTPYGMVPILTSDRDFPGLALGYQVPSFHFAINISK